MYRVHNCIDLVLEELVSAPTLVLSTHRIYSIAFYNHLFLCKFITPNPCKHQYRIKMNQTLPNNNYTKYVCITGILPKHAFVLNQPHPHHALPHALLGLVGSVQRVHAQVTGACNNQHHCAQKSTEELTYKSIRVKCTIIGDLK